MGGDTVMCMKCYGGDASPIDCVKDAEIVTAGTLCTPCLSRALDEAAELRADFEALLQAGVSREQANAIIIARIDGKLASA